MKTFYVSLVGDLLGCYLAFEADTKGAVRLYLQRHYMARTGTWKLPWCAVYEEIPDIEVNPIVIKARCGPLCEADYRQGSA